MRIIAEILVSQCLISAEAGTRRSVCVCTRIRADCFPENELPNKGTNRKTRRKRIIPKFESRRAFGRDVIRLLLFTGESNSGRYQFHREANFNEFGTRATYLECINAQGVWLIFPFIFLRAIVPHYFIVCSTRGHVSAPELCT